MGTTLTGTTPQDTYDSLIKVTDNGPISGTLKALSDGLGNDSTLSLSTTAASIAGTLAVTGNATFDTTTLFVDAANDRVGVGTITPSQKLSVSGGNLLVNNGGSPDSNSGIRVVAPISTTHYNWMLAAQQNIGDAFEITPSTAVGGTTFNSPALSILATTGVISIKSGIQFPATQVASADANTLDDYEEGTFTPTIIGTTTAGTATYGGGQAGTYTKIGRMVYFSIYLGYSGGTGTGDLRIAGLPFTIASGEIPSFSIGTFLNVALTALNVPCTSGVGNSTEVRFDQLPTGGGTQTAVPYDGSAVIAISGCYQV